MPGQIAAVDGGDVAGQQRLPGSGVVPVEEVAAVMIEGGDAAQRRLEAVDGIGAVSYTHLSVAARRRRVATSVDDSARNSVWTNIFELSLIHI